MMMNNLRGMQIQHTATEEEQQERVEKHKKFKPLSGILRNILEGEFHSGKIRKNVTEAVFGEDVNP